MTTRGEWLGGDTRQGGRCAGCISNVAGVVTEIKFGGVAGKGRLAHVVIGADDAALEDREEVFGGVAVRKPLVADILLLAVVDGGVSAHFKADLLILAALVGH